MNKRFYSNTFRASSPRTGPRYDKSISVLAITPLMPPQSYEEMGKFTYSLAVFMETLRLFPPASLLLLAWILIAGGDFL